MFAVIISLPPVHFWSCVFFFCFFLFFFLHVVVAFFFLSFSFPENVELM